MAKILLTGFEPYAGRSSNPSAEIVKALAGSLVDGSRIEGLLLPVSLDRSGEILSAAMNRIQPDVVLSTGLWPGEPVVRVERRAANFIHSEVPDNDGIRKHSQKVMPDGPAAYDVSLPVDDIVAALRRQGIPARASETAGSFLCNATLYRVLRAAQSKDRIMRCGFVHLPYLPEQVAALLDGIDADDATELHQRGDLASMSATTMAEAIITVLDYALQKLG